MTTRKNFVVGGALAATLVACSSTNGDSQAPSAQTSDANFNKIVAKPASHKHCFGIAGIDAGEGLYAMNNLFGTYAHSLNVPLDQVNMVGVLYRVEPVTIAFNDDVWNSIIIPALPKVSAALRSNLQSVHIDSGNPFLYKPPGSNGEDASVESLVGRGASFFVCANATMRLALQIGPAVHKNPQDLFATFSNQLSERRVDGPDGCMGAACATGESLFVRPGNDLREQHSTMRASLVTAMLVCLLAACNGRTPLATSTVPPSITLGPNVQVSLQNANLAHGEELIAADPVNPRHLIACSSIWLLRARAFPHNGIREVAYTSFDGGASWKQTKLTSVGAFDLDPVCDIGLNGTAYFGGASAFDPSPGHDWLSRSNNGGRTWAKPSIFPWGDRDFIAVDTSHSAYRGRLYDVSLNATRGKNGALGSADLGEIRSFDNGASFRSAVTVFHNPQTHDENEPVEYYSGPLTILRNGTIVEVGYNWPDSAKPKKIAVFVSNDGGASFSPPRQVVTRAGSPLIGSEDFKEEGASVLPLIASDRSSGPFANRIYVAWQDFSNARRHGNLPGAPSCGLGCALRRRR